MKKSNLAGAFSMIVQFGISVITPMLLCIFAAVWLKNRFGLGDRIVLVGLLLGVGSGIVGMFKAIKQMAKLAEKEDDDA